MTKKPPAFQGSENHITSELHNSTPGQTLIHPNVAEDYQKSAFAHVPHNPESVVEAPDCHFDHEQALHSEGKGSVAKQHRSHE
jgi:hypothetical protein